MQQTNPFDRFDNLPAATGGIQVKAAPAPNPLDAIKTDLAVRNDARDAAKDARDARADRQQVIINDLVIRDKQRELKEAEAKSAAQAAGRMQVKDNAVSVIDAIRNAKRLTSGWSAGFGGSVLSSIAGTDATDLRNTLDTIKANVSFDRLQAMRQASPTGGALGATSDNELKLLQDSIASLSADQSPEQLAKNLEAVERRYTGMLEALNFRVEPGDGARGAAGSGGEPKGYRLSAAQETAFQTMAARGATRAELEGLLGAFGVVQDEESRKSLDKMVAYYANPANRGNAPPPIDYSRAGPIDTGNEYGNAFLSGVGDVVEGVGDTLGLIGNPLNAGINAAFGTNLSTDIGATLRAATNLPENKSRAAAAINKGGTSALTAAGLARAALPLANAVGRGVLRTLADEPVRQGIAGSSAALAGDTADRNGAGPVVSALAALGGGVAGYSGANGALRAFGPRNEVAQAAARQGVDVLPALTGGAGTRLLTSGARQGFISDIPIEKATQKMVAQSQGVRDRAAGLAGQAIDKEDAGETVRRAANVYAKQTGATGDALYTRAYDRAGNAKVSLNGAVAKADEWIAQLEQSPTAGSSAVLNEVKSLRDQMAGGDFSVRGVRDMRTMLRAEADFKGLRGGLPNKIFGEIVDAAQGDIVSGLEAAGKSNAAGAFKTADAFWRKRVETIDEVLDPVLGKNAPRSGEQILGTLERMANGETGNAARLRRLMDAMPDQEAANVRATVIQRIGMTKPGAMADADETFSLNKFATDWNSMSPRAKALLFPGESRRALNDLATIAMANKTAGRSMNSSNTAGALTAQGAISGLLAWVFNPLVAMSAAGGQFAAGKVLASPRVARWIAQAPRSATPEQQAAYAARLSSIAAREPAIANELGALQQAIARGANDNIGGVRSSAASGGAEENNQDEKR